MRVVCQAHHLDTVDVQALIADLCSVRTSAWGGIVSFYADLEMVTYGIQQILVERDTTEPQVETLKPPWRLVAVGCAARYGERSKAIGCLDR